MFRDVPIKRKLAILATVTSGAALLLAGTGFVIYDQVAFRRDMVADLATIAEMTGYNSAAALSFNDAESAQRLLEELAAQSHVVAACVYDRQGAVFASYQRGQPPVAFEPPPGGSAAHFDADHLALFRPIVLDSETIGTIYLQSDLKELRGRLFSYGLIVTGVGLGSMLLAYLVGVRLRRIIADPISRLSDAAARVAAGQDYSIRAERLGNDELGRLTDTFNGMLVRIQANDAELRAAHGQLEKRVAERTAELAEASGLLEAMLENSPDFIYFKDVESRFVRFSQAMLHRFGLIDPAQLRGRHDAEFYGADHARQAFADEQEIIRTGRPIVGKLEHETRANGNATWVLTTKMPWRDGLGRIIGTFGISKDVTALKETESRLAHERDQLRALLDSSPDSIYFKDRDSRFVLISRSKAQAMLERVPDLRARLLGPGAAPDTPVGPEKFVGLTDADTYTDEHTARALADEQEVMRTGQPLIGKTERQTFLDGVECWSITNKMPWRDKDGQIIGTFGISKDITELKRAEEQLEQAHRQLLDTSRAAGMAEVATNVLHNVGNVLNSVNVSATLVADTARRSKAGNLGKLSVLLTEHAADLGAFLTADPRGKMVQPYLATLADEIASEQRSMIAELNNLRKNVDHIKDIVAMQQSYAKTSGVIEAVSIPDLMEDAVRMNAGSLARHDIDVVRDYQVRPVVAFDKHKVLQILVNLIRNAKYACDESGRTDKCMTLRITTDDRGVSIAVSDNGVGIPAENLLRIFNHGFTTRAAGHGFGLHSGALAAKAMGGSLTVHSDGPGHGATFLLTLPLKPENHAHAKSAR